MEWTTFNTKINFFLCVMIKVLKVGDEFKIPKNRQSLYLICVKKKKWSNRNLKHKEIVGKWKVFERKMTKSTIIMFVGWFNTSRLGGSSHTCKLKLGSKGCQMGDEIKMLHPKLSIARIGDEMLLAMIFFLQVHTSSKKEAVSARQIGQVRLVCKRSKSEA